VNSAAILYALLGPVIAACLLGLVVSVIVKAEKTWGRKRK
jgi:hypothetical protein